MAKIDHERPSIKLKGKKTEPIDFADTEEGARKKILPKENMQKRIQEEKLEERKRVSRLFKKSKPKLIKKN